MCTNSLNSPKLHNDNLFTRCNITLATNFVNCRTQPYNVVKNLILTNINLRGRGKRGKGEKSMKEKKRTSRPFSIFPSDPHLLV